MKISAGLSIYWQETIYVRTVQKKKGKTGERAWKIAARKCGKEPRFTILQMIILGILQWNYQIQIYIYL